MKTKRLLVVVGPTAIGKTAMSIQLANHFNTEIISADSRQFYQEMEIGTAVPSESELKSVKHHFIQHKSIFENYTVGDFETDAINVLKRLFKKNDFAILVGGSGLFVDAVVNGLDKFPKVDSSIKNQLMKQFESEGLVQLQEQLKTLDPIHANNVDIANPYRVIRALEICLGTGQPYSSFLSHKPVDRFFNATYLGLTTERQIIYNRINMRVDKMMEAGLKAEAKKLYEHRKLNALKTVGYRELFDYFEGKLTLEAAILEIKKNTRRFAKRQLTWYRKNGKIKWLQYNATLQEALEKIGQ